MTERDEIAARLTVLETVARQLITHMAVRAEDPPRWVQTRKALALSAINADGQRPLVQAAMLRDAVADFFDQAELVAGDYSDPAKPGTPRTLVR
ncbi:MAG: hypothetical protein P4L90_00880 [Rhodopila sp.]|nr:hypothetical protein [Rhodopila sp.]